MITNLNIKPAQVTPGQIIDMEEHNVSNFRIHLALKHASRLQLAMIENDSGNMNDEVIPTEVQNLWAQFGLIESELKFAEDHNDPPRADHEHAYKVLFVDGVEIQRMQNIKQQRIAMELELFAHVSMSLSSAKTQGHVTAKDLSKMRIQLATVSDAMILWLGKGADLSDVGVDVPAFNHLGSLDPSIDLDYSETLEPSKSAPKPHIPDAPDVK